MFKEDNEKIVFIHSQMHGIMNKMKQKRNKNKQIWKNQLCIFKLKI